MLFITYRLQAYFLKITSGWWPPFTSMQCCKRVWKLPYTRLRRSSSIAATSSTVASLSSWIAMIRHWNTRSYRNPHRKKSGTVRSGDRAGQAVSPKREITVPNISRTTAILFRTIWNGVLSSTVPLHANHDKPSRRRNIQIRNVSVGSAPPCTFMVVSRSVLLRTKNVSEKCCRENQLAVGERSRRPSCVHRQLFYTTDETMKGAHPWSVYRPVHKSDCCEKKKTQHAREVSSSNVGEKLIKMASYPATSYQRSATTFCSAVWTQSAATKQTDKANTRYLHVTCEKQHILPRTSNS